MDDEEYARMLEDMEVGGRDPYSFDLCGCPDLTVCHHAVINAANMRRQARLTVLEAEVMRLRRLMRK